MEKTIFVVDDCSFSLIVAEDALGKHFNLITLSSAAKMFKALNRITPDLILLDVEMPEMTGYEAIKQLMENDSHSKIPILFLSGMTDPADKAYGLGLGAKSFITKPFNTSALLNEVNNHITGTPRG